MGIPTNLRYYSSFSTDFLSYWSSLGYICSMYAKNHGTRSYDFRKHNPPDKWNYFVVRNFKGLVRKEYLKNCSRSNILFFCCDLFCHGMHLQAKNLNHKSFHELLYQLLKAEAGQLFLYPNIFSSHSWINNPLFIRILGNIVKWQHNPQRRWHLFTFWGINCARDSCRDTVYLGDAVFERFM